MVSRVTDLGANSDRFRIEWITQTGSTNADVLERARSGEPDGLVLVADHQSAGRGRLDRRWEAPPGANLLVSILMRPDLSPDDWHRCTSAVAVALVDACAAHGVFARIKWPNDVVVGDDKLAGILAETVRSPDGADAVVVGLGCNIGWPLAGEYPGATSLVARGARVTRAALLDDLLARIDELAPDLHERYLGRCATLGRPVAVSVPDGSVVEGTALTVDATGRLVVDAPDGTRHTFTVGDVVHARPLPN
jgi:BirA family transcriptional regulator, biotin operon repressor / biotin---[acetyl-CoA-carboxylase] ligase